MSVVHFYHSKFFIFVKCKTEAGIVDCVVGYPTFAYLLSKEYAVGLSYLCLSFSATNANLFVSFAMDCVQLNKNKLRC